MERQLVENNNVQKPQDNAPIEPAANVQAQPVAGLVIERRQKRRNDARDNIARPPKKKLSQESTSEENTISFFGQGKPSPLQQVYEAKKFCQKFAVNFRFSSGEDSTE